MSGVNAKERTNEGSNDLNKVNTLLQINFVEKVTSSLKKFNVQISENILQHEVNDDGGDKQKPKIKPQISMVELDRIVEDSLKDIEVYDDDGDDDDPDLLNELSQIIEPEKVQDATAIDLSITSSNSVSAEVTALLKERIDMYKVAEANATSSNESSRARRFNRGLSTLETMLNECLSGKTINMEDIPPEVITKVKNGSDATPVQ